MTIVAIGPKGQIVRFDDDTDPSTAGTLAAQQLRCRQAEVAILADDDDGFWPSEADEAAAKLAAQG